MPEVLTLDEGFADSARHHPSRVAVFFQADGTRIELAVRDATEGYVCEGPRIERHQLIVATPSTSPEIVLVQLDDLRELDGVPEILIALERFARGDLKGAVRYVTAAGPRWARLIDLLGGPV
jgi:hypothetical protein